MSTGKAAQSCLCLNDLNCALGGKIGASKGLPAVEEHQERDSLENLTWTNLAGLRFWTVSKGAEKIWLMP